MPYVQPLLDPRMMDALASFFPDTVAIEANTPGRDLETNQVVDSWAVVSGLEAVPCQVSPETSRNTIGWQGEARTSDYTKTRDVRTVLLRGYYPQVTTRMRADWGEGPFDIIDAHSDSQRLETQLGVEREVAP